MQEIRNEENVPLYMDRGKFRALQAIFPFRTHILEMLRSGRIPKFWGVATFSLSLK